MSDLLPSARSPISLSGHRGLSTSSFCLIQVVPWINLPTFASLLFPSSGNEGRNVKEKKNWITEKRDNFEGYFESIIPLVPITNEVTYT